VTDYHREQARRESNKKPRRSGASFLLVVAIGDEKAAIRTVIAGVLVGRGNENGRAADALLAIQQAAAIVRALELAGYEIKRRR
jgi:hypothetical protein